MHMDHAQKHGTQGTGYSSAASYCDRFSEGMLSYAIARPDQLHTMFRLSASAVLGILIGIFCFFIGAPVVLQSADAAAAYTASRSFSAYPTMQDYLSFFAAWFFHHAWQTIMPLVCLITVIPVTLCHAAVLVRGMICGYTVCMLTGGFSLFSVGLTLALGASCALCIYVGTKVLCYVRHRRKRPHGRTSCSLPWLCAEIAPLTVSVLLALSALAAGLLAISCLCTLI